jgi:hypothetical protein
MRSAFEPHLAALDCTPSRELQGASATLGSVATATAGTLATDVDTNG